MNAIQAGGPVGLLGTFALSHVTVDSNLVPGFVSRKVATLRVQDLGQKSVSVTQSHAQLTETGRLGYHGLTVP